MMGYIGRGNQTRSHNFSMIVLESLEQQGHWIILLNSRSTIQDHKLRTITTFSFHHFVLLMKAHASENLTDQRGYAIDHSI
jgi:hypothetical protein